jgi:deoxyribodipyrimidine photolyase-related protein
VTIATTTKLIAQENPKARPWSRFFECIQKKVENRPLQNLQSLMNTPLKLMQEKVVLWTARPSLCCLARWPCRHDRFMTDALESPLKASLPGAIPSTIRNRCTVVLPWDLNAALGVMPRRPEDGWLLALESRSKLKAMPWHRQKLLLVISALRHFVQEMRAKGFHVEHRFAEDYATGVREVLAWAQPVDVVAMMPREWATFESFQKLPITLQDDGGLGGHFIAPRSAFKGFAQGKKHLLMEPFYRKMRQETGLLMDGAKPIGGVWNLDAQNRRHARGVPLPRIPWCETDELTRSLMPWAERAGAWGDLDSFAWPVTRVQALDWLDHFTRNRLAEFGPYEDALRHDHRFLFHSLLSVPLNLGLLHPMECCLAAQQAFEAGTIPLSSAEGFIRQILGWREFIRGAYWETMPDLRRANQLGHGRSLPDFFWEPERTEMACLREAIESVHDHGYTHHIQRLMVICNFANLAELDPAQVSHWFWATFVDAYEWVELPNVVGMGLFATDRFTTKPYVASAAYLKRMMGLPTKGLGKHSDGQSACQNCHYDPDQRTGPNACPFNSLFWRFQDQHRALVRQNPRMGVMLNHWDRVPEAKKGEILLSAETFLQTLVPADPRYEHGIDENGA